MNEYVLTVFSKTGEKLLDHAFKADNDDAAKAIGKERIIEDKYEEYTHRLVTAKANLILFHR